MIEILSQNDLLEIKMSLQKYLSGFINDDNKEIISAYELMPISQLQLILSSDLSIEEIKKIILHEIGILRINIFSAHHYYLDIYEKQDNYEDALTLMDEYVHIAKPYLIDKGKPSLINQIKDLLSIERELEPFEYIQKWKSEYQSWMTLSLSNPIMRKNKYNNIKNIYKLIYAISFSSDNFPSLPTIVFYEK